MTPQMQAAYLKSNQTRKLGTIATSANRIALVLAGQNTKENAVKLVTETMLFIEWIGADLGAHHAQELARVQRTLGTWRKNWDEIWTDSHKNSAAQQEARVMSEQILAMAGLNNG